MIKNMEPDIFKLIIYSSTVGVLVLLLSKFSKWCMNIYYVRKNLREQWKGPPCHWFWGHIGMFAACENPLSRDKHRIVSYPRTQQHSLEHKMLLSSMQRSNGKVTNNNKDPSGVITYFAEKQKEFPYGFALYGGPLRAILRLYHPNLVKEVLHLSVADAPKPSILFRLLSAWLGQGLLLQNGVEWHRQRRLLTYSFHFDVLKSYLSAMNSCTDTLVDKWTSSMNDKNPIRIEIFSEASLLTLDTILQCLVSYKSNCQVEKERNAYISSIYAISEYVSLRSKMKNFLMMFNFFYHRSKNGKLFLRECNNVHQFSDSFIQKRRKEYAEGKSRDRKMDFLDTLLKAKDSDGSGFNDLEIRSQLDTFLFGGHDTTASAISWILYCLATHPEHQERCAVEVDSILGDKSDVMWSHLSSFSFLTRCIKEGLRIYPAAPVVVRTLNKDVHAEGKTILKGTTVQIGILGVQTSELFWKNPDAYEPDRFTLESAIEQHRHAYIPFSAGPRNCIGQNFAMNEMKIVLAKLLRRFRISLDATHKIIPCHEIVYRTKTGIYLLVEKRH